MFNKGYADLNPQQRVKCAQFLAFFDEDKSVQLTELLEPTGENSYKKVLAKIYLLANDKPEKQRYDDSLYDVFKIGVEVSIPMIIGNVSKVRRQLGLAPYTTGLNKECLSDFLRLFIVKPTTTSVPVKSRIAATAKERNVKTGFTPIFKLKA